LLGRGALKAGVGALTRARKVPSGPSCYYGTPRISSG